MASYLNILLPLLLLSILRPSSSSKEAYFSVVDYGAKPDGKTDATNPFLAAWNAACSSTTPAIVYVPNGKFLLRTVNFQGPCKNSQIGFKIDGALLAMANYADLDQSGTWVGFAYVNGLTVYGGGSFDGQGSGLWSCKTGGGRNCPAGAKSLSIGRSTNVKISGLTFVNSELFHIFIYGSRFVTVEGCKIIAPADSPNTDGIHVQQSSDVNIVSTSIMTGDDCISIGPATANVWIQSISCGPGHGVSIGSLGQSVQEEGVRNVTVNTARIIGTQNGVRIKTWGRPSSGYVKQVTFQHVTMVNVQNPIIIDQNYCPRKSGCPNQRSGVEINGVIYNDIRGTSATPLAVKFDCSPSRPCSGILLQDINLTYQNKPAEASCNFVIGRSSDVIAPPSCI